MLRHGDSATSPAYGMSKPGWHNPFGTRAVSSTVLSAARAEPENLPTLTAVIDTPA
jgi:hypothetical protein